MSILRLCVAAAIEVSFNTATSRAKPQSSTALRNRGKRSVMNARIKPALRLLVLVFLALAADVYDLNAACTVDPAVSVSFSGPEADGWGEFTIGYSFPDTVDASQRFLSIRGDLPGNRTGGHTSAEAGVPLQASGEWKVMWDTSCWPVDSYEYTATATACGTRSKQATTAINVTRSAKPTVGVSRTEPDGDGNGTVTVHYSFPQARPDQAKLAFRLAPAQSAGLWVSLPVDQQSGSVTVPYSMTCWRSGNYKLEAYAEVTCPSGGESNSVREDFVLDSKPEISMDVDSPDDNGNVDVTVTWRFKNTASSSRHIVARRLDVPGNLVSSETRAVGESGSTTFTHNVSCWPPGAWKVLVAAEQCDGERSEEEGTVTVKGDRPTAGVTLKRIGRDPVSGGHVIEGRVTYDMGGASGDWQVRADRLRYVDNSGVEHAQTNVLPSFTPAQRSGTSVFTFVVPGGAQQVTVLATATSCYGIGTGDGAIDCPDCANGSPGGPPITSPAPPLASRNPVYFNDGNMRLADVDPLPSVAGYALVRTYNSHEQVPGFFGRGWTTLFDRRLTLHFTAGVAAAAVVTMETNEVVVFRRGSDGLFVQTFPTSRAARGTFTHDAVAGTYAYRPPGASRVAVFRATDGRLIALRELGTGHEAQIAYDAQGWPASFTDSWTGTTWTIVVNPQRRVDSIEVAGRPDLHWTYQYDVGGNLTKVLAPGNATWRTYEYPGTRMTASRDALGNLIESHTYDAEGRAIDSTGPDDEIALIEYEIATGNPDETITRVTQKSGAVTDYVLRPAGGAWRTVQVRNGCGSCGARNATYVYDASGRVVRTQEANGYVTRMAYSADRLLSVEGPLLPSVCGSPESDARDIEGCRLDTDTLASAELLAIDDTVLTTYRYDDPLWPDHVTAVVTPSAITSAGAVREQTVAYDPDTGAIVATATRGYAGLTATFAERATTTTLYNGTEGAAFDPGGTFSPAWLTLPQPPLRTRSVDGSRTDVADVTTYVYYPVAASVPPLLRGRLAATRNAAGHVTRYESYDVFGNVTRAVDPNGVAAEASFDALGRSLTSTVKAVPGCDTAADPLCATDLVSTRVYSPAAGPVSAEVRPGGGVTAYTYDGRGRTRTVSRGPSVANLKEQLEYGYDPAHGKKNLERYLAFESGAWVEKRREAYGYDPLGDLTGVTHSDGTSVGYTYDAAGRVATMRDETHAAPNTTYEYDPDGRLARVTQTLAGAPNGRIATAYGYDRHGNLTSVHDPNGNVTRYLYDDFGQLVWQSSPVTGVTTYRYDEAGNLKESVDANGGSTTRQYDALGRVRETYAEVPDADGRGNGVPAERVTFTYDGVNASFAAGRLTSSADPTGTTEYRYERRGLLAAAEKTLGGAPFTTSFLYDADGNRRAIRYPSGRTVDYTFDYAGRPHSATLGNSPLVTSTAYLPFGPAIEIAYGNGTTRRMPHDARYLPELNELATGERTLAAYDYTHDPSGNVERIVDLTDATFTRTFGYDDLQRLTTATGFWGPGGYTYDRMGNMLSAARGGEVTTFGYSGTTPKLASVTTAGRDPQAVTYDPAGNERSVAASTFGYSARNFLQTAGANTYLYDAVGLRTVTRRPATIATFTVSPTVVQGGSSAVVTVTLSAAAPAGGAVVTLSSSGSFAPVPPSVTVPAGQKTAAFTVQTQPVSGAQTAVLAAAFNGSTRSESLTVTGSRLDELSLQSSSLVGGHEMTGTVHLAEPAPEDGLLVDLRSSDAAASVPSRIAIRGGETRGQFRIETSAVRAPRAVTIRASVDESEVDVVQAAFTIAPPSVATIAFNPPVLYGGLAAQATITLDGPAPEGGIELMLRANPSLLTVPDTVTAAVGTTTVSFPVMATAVETSQTAAVAVTHGETDRLASVRIDPPLLSGVVVTPPRIEGGQNATAEATLNAPASQSGAPLAITSTHPEVVGTPGELVVPAGQQSVSAELPTSAVAEPTPVVISAARNGVTHSTTLLVEPPAVTIASLTVTPAALVGSNDVAATVTLTAPAPPAGVEVELASDHPAVVVPTVVAVAAGAMQASVVIATPVVPSTVTATVTATHGVTTKSAAVTVQPPSGNHVVSLGVTPEVTLSGTVVSATVSLASPSDEPAGTDVVIATSDPLASAPVSVRVKRHERSAVFEITVGTAAASRRITIEARYGGVMQRATLIATPPGNLVPIALALSPNRATSGSTVSGVVTISGPAPSGGVVVDLAARRRKMVAMPNSVTIPAGATSVAFTIAAEPVHGKPRLTEIDATLNGITVTATLTVDPAPRTASTNRAVALCASASLQPCLSAAVLDAVATATTPTLYEQQFTLYSRELTLLAETASTMSQTPAIAYEYVWFGGQPLAQIDNATGAIDWYFNDHLGTPILQTDATARIVWRAEYEPYGTVLAFRQGEAKHQPLRLPGQTAEAGSGRYYNVFRWYRAGWGRYTQADPMGWVGEEYPYASNNPILHTDMLGLRDTGALLRRPVTQTACRIAGQTAGWFAGRALGVISAILSAPDANPVECEPCAELRQQCDELNQAVQDAKRRAGDLGACRAGMSRSELLQRRAAWLELATARARRDVRCWGGGDAGHQQAQADAWSHVGNCSRLLGM